MSTARFEIVGIKRWKGAVDGNAIDSGKLYAKVRLDASRNGNSNGTDQFAGGFATEEIRVPGGELIKRIEHLPLPFLVDIETERVSNGKTSRDMVIDLRPVVDQQLVQGASPIVKKVA